MNLYLLTRNNGDGSYSIQYALEDVILLLQELYNKNKMDYENGYGVDGDGFHYDVLTLPDGVTASSIGVTGLLSFDDIFEEFNT